MCFYFYIDIEITNSNDAFDFIFLSMLRQRQKEQNVLIYQQMERIIGKLEETENWRDKLRRACIKNQVSTTIATFFTPKRFQVAYRHFVEAQAKKNKLEGWIQNQLKAYHWLSLVLSYAQDTTILEFTAENWKLLSEIFYFKNPLLLKYQSRILISKKGHHFPWQAQEQKIYSEIMKKSNTPISRWSLPALQLFEKSNEKFVRSGKQCREKWVNHLDPSRNRGEWAQLQERELATLILKEGRKWSSIARQMTTSRTENMVKKRYIILIRKLKKTYPKIKDQDDLLREFLNIQYSLPMDSFHVQSSCEGKSEKAPQDPLEQGPYHKISIDGQQNDKEKVIYEDIKNCLAVEQQAQKEPLKITLQGSGLELTPFCTPLMGNNPRTPPLSPTNHFHLVFNTFSSYDQDVGESYYYIRKSSE